MAHRTKKQKEASKRLDAKLKKELGPRLYKKSKKIGSKHYNSFEEFVDEVIQATDEEFPEEKDKAA